MIYIMISCVDAHTAVLEQFLSSRGVQMELDSVQIKNFRSIKDQKIFLAPRCRVLVGINESGKTNILRALSMLGEGNVPTPEDKREPLDNEPPVDDAYIRFIFKLDKTDRHKVFKEIKIDFITKNLKKTLLTCEAKQLSLQDFCDEKTEGLYRINILDQNKEYTWWSLSNGYKVVESWKKPSDLCPSNYSITLSDGSTCTFKNRIINTEDYPDIPPQYLSEVTPEDINKKVGKEICGIVKDGLPDCTYWVYNEKNLLPGKIDLNGFTGNPSSCLPLKHMFELTGIPDISTEISEAKKTDNGLRNLLNRVASKATAHIRKIWNEYGDIKVDLSINGAHIDATIKDDCNHYNLSRRSDGFKRFVSFLLLISAKVRTSQLRNTLLLIDEPDIGLHPSGARYLREELIKISESNHVVYSTHSIFMIDRENTERHLIIKKKKEVTSAEDVTSSNFKDEEVILNAMGHSVFEHLEKKNIIFEGWRDKHLFRTAIKSPPQNYKELKDKFKQVGTCHAVGVKDIPHISAMLELANRECIVFSDDDNVAKQHQRDYIEKNGHGNWYRYSEILKSTNAITGEDFIKPDVFKPIIKALRSKYPDLSDLPDTQLQKSNGRIKIIENWMTEGKISNEEKKNALNGIKEEVFKNLKTSDIEMEYFELLTKFAELFAKTG